MQSGMFEDLELDIPRVKSVNRLSNVAPQGLGTSLPEACTSYLPRMGHDLSVTTGNLLSEEIFPAMGESKLSRSLLRGSSRIYSRPGMFNGFSDMTSKLIKTLERLTGRHDLRYLTLLPLKTLIDSKGIFRNHRAWCQQCLVDLHSKGGLLYEALPWALVIFRVCSIHGSPLTTRCPGCNAFLPVITRASLPGYCSQCGTWLGKKSSSGSNYKPTDFDIWAANNICLLLTTVQKVPHILSNSALSKRIAEYINSAYNDSASALARSIGIPRATVKRWRAGNSMPSLEHLLRLSFCTRTPIDELITEGLSKAKRPDKDSFFHDGLFLKRHCSGFDHRKARRFLLSVLNGKFSPPLSMAQVAKMLGYSKRTLYRHFPVLCRSISAKAGRYRTDLKLGRINQEKLFIERAAEQLCFDGFYPSYDAIERKTGKNGILRSQNARKTWKNKLVDMGLRDHESPGN